MNKNKRILITIASGCMVGLLVLISLRLTMAHTSLELSDYMVGAISRVSGMVTMIVTFNMILS